MTLTDELIQTFNQLDEVHQQQLLAYARSMMTVQNIKGESGESIVSATGYFDLDALDEMETAINDANRIDWHGWE